MVAVAQLHAVHEGISAMFANLFAQVISSLSFDMCMDSLKAPFLIDVPKQERAVLSIIDQGQKDYLESHNLSRYVIYMVCICLRTQLYGCLKKKTLCKSKP